MHIPSATVLPVPSQVNEGSMSHQTPNTTEELRRSYLKRTGELTDQKKAVQKLKAFWEDFLTQASRISAQTEDDLLFSMGQLEGDDLARLKGALADVVDARVETRNFIMREIEEAQEEETRLHKRIEELDEEYAYERKRLQMLYEGQKE